MAAKNGAVAGQVIKTVHDDGDHDVQHDEAAQEYERHEVEVGDVGAASPIRIDGQSGGDVQFDCEFVANSATDAGHHNFGPSFSGGTSKEDHESLGNGAKVGVSLDGSAGV